MRFQLKARAGKTKIYETISLLGKAMACGKRLEILDLLTQGEKSVDALAEQCALSTKLTSAHLRTLKSARLVTARKEGKHVHYRAASAAVGNALTEVRKLAHETFHEIQATIDQYATNREAMVGLGPKSLLKAVRNGDVIVIDVRPEDEYMAGHIPSARSVPLSKLKEMVAQLPRGKKIIAYCRGPYCVFSHKAVQTLTSRGFDAGWVNFGVTEWQNDGFSLE